MKKIVLLILLLCFVPTVFAAASNDKKEALQRMRDGHKYLHDSCVKAADNFRYDHQFAGYLKYTCMMYESNRSRLMASVYTISTELDSKDRNNYPIDMANFAIKMDAHELLRYRTIINEYCKYNSYKYVKKDPEACSPTRVHSLFN